MQTCKVWVTHGDSDINSIARHYIKYIEKCDIVVTYTSILLVTTRKDTHHRLDAGRKTERRKLTAHALRLKGSGQQAAGGDNVSDGFGAKPGRFELKRNENAVV